ncbi:RidA family protein [Croceicoccus sp. F390]|uniref:RidA family protein n=1 Tax=Croceicoccus esteveae TaxID=3075597 RepID=A0ABU2ZIU2_9SPHN|nr:RidA family protein [Croceicoccus sp. F390]MDT0576515.1 RidA family protein [Croceicoccus sp. F390]
MNGDVISERLTQLGVTLPDAAAAVASYVPALQTGNMLYISGQLPFVDGVLKKGRLGHDVSLDEGVAAARACGIMILAQAQKALGSLDRIERIVKLGAFVASSSDFTDQPAVANGASELIADVLGEAGRHTRSAVGVAALPLGACVEIDAICMVRPN